MSVHIEFASRYRSCNSCGSNDNVITVTTLMRIGNTTQGSQVALCKKCARILKRKLDLFEEDEWE